jgi:TolB-like protein/Flp pilus assembly protein TadD
VSGEAPELGEGQPPTDPLPAAQVPNASSDVFISYASQDAAIADAIVAALERHDITCWISPRDVTPGASYAGQIIHAIDAAKASVLILSRDAESSPHVLREVERSASKRHPIVSLRIDQAPLPADFEYFLSASHWLDTSASDMGRALPKLVAAVQLALNAPVATPAGAPTSHVPASAVPGRSPNRTSLLVATVVGLGLVGFAAERLWLSSRRVVATPALAPTMPTPVPATAAPTIPEKSVAVLPFLDMSEKKDQEYFSDGLSEELIGMLAKVPALRVPARTSSFYFKGKSTTVAEIARVLGVAHVLEGSVRKSGKHLRITAQLVRADNGYHLWSETYDRQLDDIFKVQDEIAGAVVKALKLSLLATARAEASHDLEPGAYEAYLKGRYYWNKRTAEGMQKAQAFFQQAIDKDPGYGAAYSGLADSNSGLTWHGFTSPAETLPRANAAALKAIEIDPQSAEAHASLALVLYHKWDWPEAESEFNRALELNPRYANAHHWYGDYLSVQGRHDEALVEAKKALDLDPLNLMIGTWVGLRYYLAHKYDDALGQSRNTVELDPNFAAAHLVLGETYLQLGLHERGLAELQNATSLSGNSPLYLAQVAVAYALAGRKTEALQIISQLQTTSNKRYVSPYGLAQIYAALNDKEQTFKWLQLAYDDRAVWMTYLAVDPVFDRYRSDQRFQDLLRRVRLLH